VKESHLRRIERDLLPLRREVQQQSVRRIAGGEDPPGEVEEIPHAQLTHQVGRSGEEDLSFHFR
jgi:hypothetical protein